MPEPAEAMQFARPCDAWRCDAKRRGSLEVGDFRREPEVAVRYFAPKARVCRAQLLRHDQNLIGTVAGVAPAQKRRGQCERHGSAAETLDRERADLQPFRNIEAQGIAPRRAKIRSIRRLEYPRTCAKTRRACTTLRPLNRTSRVRPRKSRRGLEGLPASRRNVWAMS